MDRLLSLALLLLWSLSLCQGADRPNILWITSEDNSPYLGCYGDMQAQTPHLDRFSKQGVRYLNAFSSAPVCSAARSTLITGMNASTLGIHNHRSSVAVPGGVVYYPQVFREAGYYCTNNSKTDYNMSIKGKRASWRDVGWHESSGRAHYRNRRKDQPFFAVFNTTLSHEGQTTDKAYRGRMKENPPRRVVPPGEVILPPYHPDTPVIRENWSRYFDNLFLMDKWVGDKLRELEELGEADNTIVFYYADHGGALPRGKRNIHDSGSRVPLIIRFPEKWKHLAPGKPGETSDHLVAFVDFPATAVNLCGLEIPGIWEGRPFLGPGAKEREFVYLFRGRMDERYDTVRAIRTKEHLYVHNFSPHRPLGQAYTYPFRVLASMGSWYEAFRAGKCNDVQARFWKRKQAEELYIIKDDPFQIRNLAAEKEYRDVFNGLRTKLWNEVLRTRDTGLIPEGMYAGLSGSGTIYEFTQSEVYPADEVLTAASKAVRGDLGPGFSFVTKCAQHESPLIRYWGATGALMLGKEAAPLMDDLVKLLDDPVFDVRVVAAEALGHIGESAKILPVLVKVVNEGNVYESLAAANALEALGRDGAVPMATIKAVIPKKVRAEEARVVEALEKIR